MISALFIAQSFPKWFVHFWMTFCKNSIRISCQIIFVNKHWPQSCLYPFKIWTTNLYCNTMIIIIVLVIDSSCNILMPVCHTANTGGGVNLPWFWVRTCELRPRTPPHSYTRRSLKKKTDSFIYTCTSNIENCTHSYTIFQILLIHIPFWVKKIPHWCTFEVKIIPIYILGCLKIQPHVCIYLFNGSYHPPVTANTTTGFRGGWYPGHHLPCPPPPPYTGGKGPGSTKVSVLPMYFVLLPGPHFPV